MEIQSSHVCAHLLAVPWPQMYRRILQGILLLDCSMPFHWLTLNLTPPECYVRMSSGLQIS